MTSRKSKILIGIGFLLILGGLLFNEWTLAALFSADGTLGFSNRVVIWGFNMLLVSIGLLLIVFRKRIQVVNIAILIISFFLCAVILEVALRLVSVDQPEFKIAQENPHGTGSYRLIPNLRFSYSYHGKDLIIQTNSMDSHW